MRKEYRKLVRDRIPEIIRRGGRGCAVEVMSESEYRDALLQKLVEEATEAREAAQAEPQKIAIELADLYEVIDAVMAAYGIQNEAVLELQAKRRKQRGGFVKRLQLLWADSV